jgi:hypothetical protein
VEKEEAKHGFLFFVRSLAKVILNPGQPGKIEGMMMKEKIENIQISSNFMFNLSMIVDDESQAKVWYWFIYKMINVKCFCD